jgi:glyoxylase-like metal-dependent hydrolase (beta-lactamase superfamily II)
MRARVELTPGIHLIDKVQSNTYLLVEEGGLTVVDTGMPGSAPKILAYVRRLGREASDVRRILLTHQHFDHVGGAAELAATCAAPIWAHPLDAPAIEGKAWRDRPQGPLGAIFSVAIFPRLRAAPVARQIRGGETLPILEADGGLRVIETPGHTLGSVAFYLPGRRLLLAGDSLMHLGGRVIPPFALVNRDTPLARRSFADLAQLDVEASLPGHGAPIPRGAGARIADAVKRLALESPSNMERQR